MCQITILVYAVPLHKRPLYQGLFGAIFGVASVVGPLLGGAFTTNVTWRWCFSINLPFGGIAMAIILFLLPVPDRDTTKLPMRAKLAQLDFYGTAAFIPGIVCLLLALQWGGLDYPWRSGRIIALLVLAGVLIIAFVVVQVVLPKTATVPPRIFMQRSIMAGVFVTLCIGSQMMIFVYFVPVWFQAIQGVSAVQSGIRMLPMMLSMVVASGASGAIVAKIGYYLPTMYFGIVLMSIGAGLITTFGLTTSQAEWVGYQFLYGFGLGCTFQAPNLAAQTVLPTRDVPIGTSLMFFSQLLGGAIFTSVGQNVLDGELLKRLSSLPGFTPEFLKNTGATSLTNLPDSIRAFVIGAYNESLRKVFQVGLILTCLTVLGAAFMEWRSVKERKLAQEKKDAEKGAAAAEAEAEAAKTAGSEHGDAVTDAEVTDVDEKAAERKAEHEAAKEGSTTNGAAAAATSAEKKEEA
jgi:MFS family permease